MDAVGVVLGAFLGFVSAYVIARFQAGREDRFRFAMLKQEKYAEYLRLLGEHVRILHQHMSLRVRMEDERPTAVPALSDTDSIAQLWAEIAILAEVKVWMPARDLLDQVRVMDAYAWDDAKPPHFLHGDVLIDDYMNEKHKFDAALDTFMSAAKADLGINH